MDWGAVFAYGGVAVAAAFAGFGSSIGVSIAGQVAAGVVAEDPEKFGRTIILTALPGTQGIYGFVIAMLILLRLPGFQGSIPMDIGLKFLVSGIPVGLVGFISGIWQGKASAAGIGILARRPEEYSKGIIYAGMVETYAILSFIMSYLLFTGV